MVIIIVAANRSYRRTTRRRPFAVSWPFRGAAYLVFRPREWWAFDLLRRRGPRRTMKGFLFVLQTFL